MQLPSMLEARGKDWGFVGDVLSALPCQEEGFVPFHVAPVDGRELRNHHSWTDPNNEALIAAWGAPNLSPADMTCPTCLHPMSTH